MKSPALHYSKLFSYPHVTRVQPQLSLPGMRADRAATLPRSQHGLTVEPELSQESGTPFKHPAKEVCHILKSQDPRKRESP